MYRSAKMLAAAAVFAAPVVLGVAYTGAASVGGGSDSGSGQFEDQFILSTDQDGEYTIDREQTGDAVTIVITGPDGNVVELQNTPEAVASAAAEYASPNWTPPLNEFSVIDEDTPCYHADQLAQSSDGDTSRGAITSNPDGLFALESHSDGTVNAAYFDDSDAYSHEELVAHRESGGLYLDLEGAQPLIACED